MKSLVRILFVRYIVVVVLVLLPVSIGVIYVRSRFADAVIIATGGAVLIGALSMVAAWTRKSLLLDLQEFGEALQRLVVSNEIRKMPLPALRELSALAGDMDEVGSKVRRNYRLLERERDTLKAVLESIDAGIVLLGKDGKIKGINSSAERILGTSREFATGRAFIEVHHAPAFERLIEKAKKEAVRDVEVRTTYPKRKMLKVSACPVVRRETKKSSGTVLVIEDITARRKLERTRRDFVANVSHELRTPTSNLRAVVDALLSGASEEPEARARFLGDLDKESSRLARIIEDLLVLSRMESDEISMEEEVFDIGQLLDDVSQEKQEIAIKHDVGLSFIRPEREILIRGDMKLLRTACSNLIDNAIKYNRPGGKVEVNLVENPGEVGIKVVDTGIGIPERHQARIFERFYRVDKARSRDTGGTGLGLSIVKHVAELHGGYVDVESKEGEGSTFSLVIPQTPSLF